VKDTEEEKMNDIDKATQTQINNIQAKTGKNLEELRAILQGSGLEKHGELRAFLQKELGLGYGDANTLVQILRKSDGASAAKAKGASEGDVLDEIYSGAKASLRPIHTALMDEINRFGEFEIAPKKGYVSLRRKKQFAMIGPATKTQVEVGLNMKGVPGTERLVEQAPGGMCQYKVRLGDAAEVDGELLGWLRQAYESAG
jgi:hypothetical protein